MALNAGIIRSEAPADDKNYSSAIKRYPIPGSVKMYCGCSGLSSNFLRSWRI